MTAFFRSDVTEFSQEASVLFPPVDSGLFINKLSLRRRLRADSLEMDDLTSSQDLPTSSSLQEKLQEKVCIYFSSALFQSKKGLTILSFECIFLALKHPWDGEMARVTCISFYNTNYWILLIYGNRRSTICEVRFLIIDACMLWCRWLLTHFALTRSVDSGLTALPWETFFGITTKFGTRM